MTGRMTFRTVLIGDGTLVLRCADHLIAAGHTIDALLSTDAAAVRWASANGTRLVASPAELLSAVEGRGCDYLFSIVNFRILGPEIIAIARRAAINYHDAPLPRYAGINATSWAIMAGKRVHAVSWHLIAAEVDTGDILVQRPMPIDEDDTSLSLNVKCHEAAASSFVELMQGLESGTLVPRPQDLSQRTYFARHRAPPNAGVIDWRRPVLEIARLVRALDFGPYDNSLGSAKILLDGTAYLCRSARALSGVSGVPGAVLGVTDESITVACGVGALDILAVAHLDGRGVSIPDWIGESQLQVGSELPLASSDQLQRIEATFAETAPHEQFWVRRLAELEPATHPFLSVRDSKRVERRRSRRVEIPSILREMAQARGETGIVWAAALIGEYSARVAGVGVCDIAFVSETTQALSDAAPGLMQRSVPLRIERRSGERLTDAVARLSTELARVERRKTWVCDAAARRTGFTVAPPLPVGLVVGDAAAIESPAPLTFVVAADGAECYLIYEDHQLTADDAERVVGQLETFVGDLARDAERSLNEINLVNDDERHRLLVEWNDSHRDYPRDVPLASLVQAQVARTPDAPAVTFADETLSYAELNARANRLARELVRHGAGPDVLIGLAVERSVDMMVALLAIVKSGSAYVPLDPMFPKDRLAYMVEDSGLRILITQTSLRASLPAFAGAVLDVDAPTWDGNSHANLDVPVGPDHLALVIYTSGSTGRPKGVEIGRGALINLLWSMREWLALSTNDRLLAVTTISFDIAGADIWLPWLVGAQTIVASRAAAADGEQLETIIKKHDITFLQATPVTWRQLLGVGWVGKSDMQAVCTGEAMPIEVASELAPLVGKLWNLYGPTETTIWSTGVRVSTVGDRISIGRPVANTQCYILDEHGQPVPAGIPGELYIAGDGLARGYLNRPDLTAEKFVPNPFAANAGDRMYRTGDVARYLPDGTIECLGRTDHQVKIRGYRIELGEIESALRTHPSVRQAVVVAREDVPGDKRLVAYVVSHDEPAPSQTLRAHLKESLPDFMVPSAIVTLDAIPLTANGKIDRRALPSPEPGVNRDDTSVVTARTHVEKQLSEIWEDLFKLPRVGVADNFFDLGGHSIMAVQMMARVARVFGKQLPLNALFESPTIERLAKHIEDASRTLDLHSIVSIQAAGARPPVFWIPGGAGLGLFRLRSIVTRLGPDQPVYGLGSNRPESLDHIEGVEERSRKYVELVRRVQPRGPYCFVGFCAGGLIAYEMAQQLSAVGETVPFVGMINCPFPNFPKTRVANLLIELQRQLYKLRAAWSRGVGPLAFVREKLAARRHVELPTHGAPVSAPDPEKAESARRLQQLLDAAGEVFGRYRPRRYTGSIALLNSDDMAYRGVSKSLDRRLHWKKYVAHAEVVEFKGGHDEVFDASEAGSFGETLQRALERATNGAAAAARS